MSRSSLSCYDLLTIAVFICNIQFHSLQICLLLLFFYYDSYDDNNDDYGDDDNLP
jgi:hypothetical protein